MELRDQLLFRPHQELKTLLATGVPVHVLVNPVEYHGPHLSLGNDRILSERLSRLLHERLSRFHGEQPYLVGGVIEFGCDPTPGAGSTGLTFDRLVHLIQTLVDGLITLGVQRVIFHTFHGSPFHSHALQKGVLRLQAAGVKAVSVFDQVLRTIVEFDAAYFEPLRHCMDNEADFQSVMSRLPTDFHAGFFETSVALYLAPETVASDYTRLPPCPELPQHPVLRPLSRLAGSQRPWSKELEHLAHAMGWMGLQPFPGYTSYPSLASEKAGAFFVEEMILPLYDRLCQDVLWGTQSAPATQFAWLKPLAPLLGGRV